VGDSYLTDQWRGSSRLTLAPRKTNLARLLLRGVKGVFIAVRAAQH
jgi:hypothetical protein